MKLFSVLSCVVNIFGLLPFDVDKNRKKVKINRMILVYSIVLNSIILLACILIITRLLYELVVDGIRHYLIFAKIIYMVLATSLLACSVFTIPAKKKFLTSLVKLTEDEDENSMKMDTCSSIIFIIIYFASLVICTMIYLREALR